MQVHVVQQTPATVCVACDVSCQRSQAWHCVYDIGSCHSSYMSARVSFKGAYFLSLGHLLIYHAQRQ